MQNFHSPAHTIIILQLLVSAFLAILFLQSGFDKVVDWKTNLGWLREHFSKSIFGVMVPALLAMLTILELSAGLLSAVGCLLILRHHPTTIAFYGALIAAVTTLALFLGQRIAKDYAGSATIGSYFLIAVAAIYLLGNPL